MTSCLLSVLGFAAGNWERYAAGRSGGDLMGTYEARSLGVVTHNTKRLRPQSSLF